jgi:hypothetical protein
MTYYREVGGTSNAGTQTAALAYGGEYHLLTVNNEQWNGTTWTELANLNTARGKMGYNGISTSAIYVGGGTTPGLISQNRILEWN